MSETDTHTFIPHPTPAPRILINQWCFTESEVFWIRGDSVVSGRSDHHFGKWGRKWWELLYSGLDLVELPEGGWEGSNWSFDKICLEVQWRMDWDRGSQPPDHRSVPVRDLLGTQPHSRRWVEGELVKLRPYLHLLPISYITSWAPPSSEQWQ